jgi:hypothetical protein
MSGPVVILKTKGEDSREFDRLVIESGNAHLPEGGSMSKNDEREIVQEQHAEDKDEVEAHIVADAVVEQHNEEDRDVLTDEPDFEAHRKSH